MRIYKEITIDLEAERRRIEKVNYTPEERAQLHACVNAFEAGHLDKCRELTAGIEEYLCPAISDVLFDMQNGAYYCVIGDRPEAGNS